MSGKAIIVAGSTGVGKTTWVQDRLKKLNPERNLIYDVNDEHGKYYTHEPILDIEEFTNICQKSKGCVQVFEEATIFFDTRGSDKALRDILVRKRHTKSTIFLIFHSLNTVPLWVYRLCTHVVLFKTIDSPKSIEKRFEDVRLISMFNEVHKSKNKHECKILSIY